MREILFRGKRIDNGEWVEGWLYKRIVHISDCHQNVVVDAIEVYDGKRHLSIAYYTVDPSTVGQHTGLTDKNGKRIFEGDMVVYDNSPYNAYCTPQNGEIVWRNGSLCFKYRPWNSDMYRSLCSDDFFAAKCEVVGNIHDNPDYWKR